MIGEKLRASFTTFVIPLVDLTQQYMDQDMDASLPQHMLHDRDGKQREPGLELTDQQLKHHS